FAKQVGFGFFAEVGFDDAGKTTAGGAGVGQGQIAGHAGLDLVDSDQVGHAAALVVGATHGVARSLGGNHDDVDVITGNDLTVVHVETVGKRQGGTRTDVVSHLAVVNLGDVFVGQEDHDDVGLLDGFADFSDLQTS